jgi:hypothetical protein
MMVLFTDVVVKIAVIGSKFQILFGREQELALLSRKIAASGCCLLTAVGEGASARPDCPWPGVSFLAVVQPALAGEPDVQEATIG